MRERDNTCPLQQSYKFDGLCEVKTCKNHSMSLKPSGCIAIERVDPDGKKMISDVEIHALKFQGHDVSTRLVSLRRKEAVDNVMSVIVLDRFFTHLKEKTSAAKLNSIGGGDLAKLEKEFPLNVKTLGVHRWMWHYILDGTFDNYLQKQTADSNSPWSVLSTTRIQYEAMRAKYTRGKYEHPEDPAPIPDSERSSKDGRHGTVADKCNQAARQRGHDNSGSGRPLNGRSSGGVLGADRCNHVRYERQHSRVAAFSSLLAGRRGEDRGS